MTILKAVLIVIGVEIIALLLFIYSGIYDVGADDPHARPVRWLLETTRSQAVARGARDVSVPTNLQSSERVSSGARTYASMCAVCHLAPGMDPTPTHTGLNPEPPRLAEEAGEYDPARLFWIVKHGFKMTGMPAWGETHSDETLWDVVAFMNQLPKLTPAEYQKLTASPAEGGHGHGGGHAHDGGHGEKTAPDAGGS